jgi:hypothetical protein
VKRNSSAVDGIGTSWCCAGVMETIGQIEPVCAHSKSFCSLQGQRYRLLWRRQVAKLDFALLKEAHDKLFAYIDGQSELVGPGERHNSFPCRDR